MIPRPDSIETFLSIMKVGFNPEKAGTVNATIGFRFSGAVTGSCRLVIGDGALTPAPGEAENADLTIETPFDVWMDVLTGKADGQQMFMEQKYTVTGDLSLLMRMSEFFGD